MFRQAKRRRRFFLYGSGVRSLTAFATLLQTASPAVAQDELIVITGRGMGESLSDRVYDITTIERERLERSTSNRLEDLLREVPGFQQFRRSDARSANPTSQGATLRALGGNASSRALLILDGVPQSDPFGGWISWPAYDPRRLERIRVVRGGGSGVHGPGALAGTIELESRSTDAANGLAASLAYGSRDGVDSFAALGIPLGEGHVSLSAAWMIGDGFVPVIASQRGPADRPAPYAQGSLAWRAVAPISRTVELQTNLSAFSDKRERGTGFSDIKTRGADASVRLVGRGGIPFAALLYVQTRDFSNLFAAVNASRTVATKTLDQYSVPSLAYGARIEVRPAIGQVELWLGSDFRRTVGKTNELFSFAAGLPTRIRHAGGQTLTMGAFGEATWQSGNLTATGGARLDRWRISNGGLEERQLASGAQLVATNFADRKGWEVTGRGGLAWQAFERLSFRAAYYLGWRLPTLNELYRPFRVGPDATAANAALTPERLMGGEIGAQWRPVSPLRLGITLFVNRLEQAIANVTLGQGPGQFPGVGFVAGQFRQRQNVEAVVSRGVELGAEVDLGAWDFAAGYSFADAKVEASGVALALEGLRPAQSPRHTLAASLGWSGASGQAASFALRYVGDQFEDDLNAELIPDALTFDAFGTWPLTRQLGVELRAENLSDARVVAGISGAGIVERATPRTLWIGLRWRR